MHRHAPPTWRSNARSPDQPSEDPPIDDVRPQRSLAGLPAPTKDTGYYPYVLKYRKLDNTYCGTMLLEPGYDMMGSRLRSIGTTTTDYNMRASRIAAIDISVSSTTCSVADLGGSGLRLRWT